MPEASVIESCGEDLLIARSLGKLESARFTLQTLRGEFQALRSGRKSLSAKRLDVLQGFTNEALTALNDLAWRLQLRIKDGDKRRVGVLAIQDIEALKSGALTLPMTEDALAKLSKDDLITKYRELALRRRILSEEFNKMSDNAIALQRSQYYRLSKRFGLRGTARIDSMVDTACALDTLDS
ncbi:hypothetical protein GCM10009069_05700 [Algimonas arctica]|uniref:Uncharacterized protein n=2 Tax=Algimonas arctica TaxID=1479486 RepID=A0A8J3CNZ9_9PROT|nr:hypothetical protein GCM10009069_05700 [Algimonas arctica]